MPRSHIGAAAEICKALNLRLNRPGIVMLSNKASSEIAAIIEQDIKETLDGLGIDDPDTKNAVRNSVTVSIYITLADLLVQLEREQIRLEKTS